MIADKVSNVPERSLAALRAGEPLRKAKFKALRRFTVRMVESRGNPAETKVKRSAMQLAPENPAGAP
jgi:hypothetical protein